MENLEKRTQRKALIGVVESRSGDKSIKVVFFYKKPHSLFKKEIKRKTVLHVHDADNVCNVGDKVEIMSTRPLSHLKRWRVVRVLEKARS